MMGDRPVTERSSDDFKPLTQRERALVTARGAEVERLREALFSDETAEFISRRLNPGAWEIVARLLPATREEYEEALRSEARRAMGVLVDRANAS